MTGGKNGLSDESACTVFSRRSEHPTLAGPWHDAASVIKSAALLWALRRWPWGQGGGVGGLALGAGGAGGGGPKQLVDVMEGPDAEEGFHQAGASRTCSRGAGRALGAFMCMSSWEACTVFFPSIGMFMCMTGHFPQGTLLL